MPVLYNHYNPNTQQYFKYGECLLSSGTSSTSYSSKHINPYYPSRPGKHPPTAHLARLFSRPGKHPTTTHLAPLYRAPCTVIISAGETPTNRASARLYSRPGKHPQSAHPHSYTVWLPQGFGRLPNSLTRLWETPYTTY